MNYDLETEKHLLSLLTAFWPELSDIQEQLHPIPVPYSFSNTDIIPTLKSIQTAKENGRTHFVFCLDNEMLLQVPVTVVNSIVEQLSSAVDECKYFLFTDAVDGEKAYTALAKKHNWSTPLTILAAATFVQRMKQPNTEILRKVIFRQGPRDKLFLCFNRIARRHRIQLLAELLSHALIDRAFYSFAAGADLVLPVLDRQMQQVVQQNRSKLPMHLNLDDSLAPTIITKKDVWYHANSYFSLITETQFYEEDEQNTLGITLSEKTFRAIFLKHPFIILGKASTLDQIKLLGFKTYHPFIDESYDHASDEDRITVIVNEIVRLNNKSKEEWVDWLENVQAIAEYNYSHAMNSALNLFATTTVQGKI